MPTRSVAGPTPRPLTTVTTVTRATAGPVLMRHVVGDQLRRLRLEQGRTLRDVSEAASVSHGYLSEVERGQKESSSELLAAMCGALEIPLSDFLQFVSDDLARAERRAGATAVTPVVVAA